MIRWQWSRYEDLSKNDLYELLAVRQQVFAVEQQINCVDPDGLDKKAWHLLGWWAEAGNDRRLAAYLRVLYPGCKFSEPAIGRVLTIAEIRGTGVGHQMMAEAIKRIDKEVPGSEIRMSAQCHLEKFYLQHGFEISSEPYLEEGIEHVEMTRQPLDYTV